MPTKMILEKFRRPQISGSKWPKVGCKDPHENRRIEAGHLPIWGPTALHVSTVSKT